MSRPPARPDVWARLRGATDARIGLGRAGAALPTTAMLALQFAHARARDAVHAALPVEAIQADLAGFETLVVDSQADGRLSYLARPDLGRRLAIADAARLPRVDFDLIIVLADGLSAEAVAVNAPPLVRALAARLGGWAIGPIVIARQGRVALGDEIGERLGTRAVVVLIGERPGLSVADSLGVYLTYEPRIGRRDSERNCISNIHADGLSYEAAADMLVWLMNEAARRKLTGVDLKAERSFPEQSPAPHRLG